ncbi:MAG: indolepyruvate ferredoxin oxidoreductase subunit alpha [Treponema sp.]
MAYVIEAGKCTNCGTCEPECPVGAISESSDKRVIEADTCISCGACAAVCPTDAIAC